MFGRADARHREHDMRALEAADGRSLHIALLNLQVGAHGFQRLQMQVDRTRTDRATARQRHRCVPGTGNQRSENVEARPHLPHLFIRRDRAFQLGSVQVAGRFALRPIDLHAQSLQQLRQEARVRQARHVRQRDRLIGQQASHHELQRRVLGAGNGNAAVELSAANNVQSIHGAHL